MKKSVRIFLCIAVLTLFAINCAFALGDYSGISLQRKTGTYVGGTIKKTAYGNASLSVSTSNGASMYMQVRKTDYAPASDYRVFNGQGSDDSVPYGEDGYGHSLGRVGYNYVCRLAHRKQSPVSFTIASGDWHP